MQTTVAKRLAKLQHNGLDARFPLIKANQVFRNVSDKNHNGDLEVLSATQDKGIIPRRLVDIDIKYNDENLPTYKRVRAGNFVISLRSFQGGIEYSEFDGIISPAYIVLAPKVKICDTYYKYYFKSVDYIKRLQAIIYGIRDGKQINFENFGSISIHNPPLPEQRKIAAILSTQDKLIELKSSLLDEKLRQKKYLMQVLLTGQKRLNHIKTQWIKCKIMDCGSCVSGNGFPIKYQGELSGTYPFYKVSDFNVLSNHRYMQRANNYITTEVAEILSCNIIPAYSIIFAKIGAAIFLERKRINTTECCIDNNMMAFVPNDKVEPQYICYLFQKMRFGNIVEASALPTINAANLGNIVIHLPSIDEQKAIANILSTADREIELLRQELELEKLKKRALMQLLLTGKVRVNTDE